MTHESPQPSALKIWLLAARPKTLWAAIIPVAIGTCLAYDAGARIIGGCCGIGPEHIAEIQTRIWTASI